MIEHIQRHPEPVVRQYMSHLHDGISHAHECVPGDDHTHPEYDVPASPGNEPAVFACVIDCGNLTSRKGQPCHPCLQELGVGA